MTAHTSTRGVGLSEASPCEETNAGSGSDAHCLLCRAPLQPAISGLFDSRFGIPGFYSVWHCSSCGADQLYPLPTPAELKNLYEDHYNFGGEKGTLYITLREWFFASWIYRLWVSLDGDVSFHRRKGAGKLLDIGCNQGRGLQIYARNGFQVEGLELNETAAEVARQKGFPIHTVLLENFAAEHEYDVAVMSNVLEHTLDPRAMLLDVRRVLKQGGKVWISCPNADSALRSIFGKSWINWHTPFHIVHFSRTSLPALLRETGFTDVKVKNITPALWLTSSMVSWLFAKPGKPTRQLRNLLVAAAIPVMRLFFFPLLWIANRSGRGDCLLCTAVAD